MRSPSAAKRLSKVIDDPAKAKEYYKSIREELTSEDIRVNRMLHNHCLAKSISDTAWSGFFRMLVYKAEWAGRQLVIVNPAYTSQDCSNCGHRQKMLLSERIFKCPCCGLELDRDHNAALNILRLGLQSLGSIPKRPIL